MQRHPLFLAAALCGSTLAAQQHDADGGFNCLANHPGELQRHIDENPGAWEAAMVAKAELEAHTLDMAGASAQRQVYPITMVVHIIHNGGAENISDLQVLDAVRILNEDFNKLNADWQNVRPEFIDLVGNVGIQFSLAKKDPYGACTNGITRTESTQTYSGDFDMTQLIQWPRNRYMNVWVAASANGAAGYTYYPQWLNNWPQADGIVVQHTYLGSMGTGSPTRSRVLSHEVGHWLNLKHCWGDSNSPGSNDNCMMDDDVTDTPLTRGWTSCALSGSSCGSELDNVENYMEYSYCDKMFTHGQADRMIAALTSNIAQRSTLWQTTTLLLTGILEEQALCEASFVQSALELCSGATVQFTDMSYHGVSSRSWSFPGGTPASSDEPAPMVTYDTPGSYPVTLMVSDGMVTETVASTTLMTVLPATGHSLPWSEGFEEPGVLDGTDWTVVNPDGDQTWEVTNATAYTGTHSVRILNQPASAGSVDRLHSGTFDMSEASTIEISFRYAYAQRTAINDDRLRLYVSKDCGDTWSLRKQLRGSNDLNSGGMVTGSFVPGGGQDWRHTTVANIGTTYHVPDFRFRFEFLSDGGNNLYLDDININSMPVGLAEQHAGDADLLLVPNPTEGGAVQMHFQLAKGGPLRVMVLDALGRTVRELQTGPLAPGLQRMDLDMSGSAPGAYLVRLHGTGIVRTARLVIR